jgi:uncharacterized OsmC-like protein
MAQINTTTKKHSPAEETMPGMKTFNGFDMVQLQGLVDAVKSQPKLAEAMLSAKVEWREGFYTEAYVKDFVAGGVKNETSRVRPFMVPQDHPYELGGGTNKGATAGELLLATLGHCLTGGFANATAVLGIPIESLKVEVEGEVDLHGVLGLPEPGAIRPGFLAIRARYLVRSGAHKEQLLAAAKMAEDLSPVKDSLRAVKFSSQLLVQ